MNARKIFPVLITALALLSTGIVVGEGGGDEGTSHELSQQEPTTFDDNYSWLEKGNPRITNQRPRILSAYIRGSDKYSQLLSN